MLILTSANVLKDIIKHFTDFSFGLVMITIILEKKCYRQARINYLSLP